MKPDIDPKLIEEWREDYNKMDFSNWVRQPSEEHFFAGNWMELELKKLNCPCDLLERICFAFGQRCAMFDAFWENATKAVSEYKEGRWEEPGDVLAKQLIREKFGAKPNPQEMFRWFASQGVDIVKLMEQLGRIPKVPPIERN